MQVSVCHGSGRMPVGHAALDVFDHAGDVLRRHVLGIDDDVRRAFRARSARVVVVGDDVETGLAERQLGVVEVENVRVILVDEVLAAQEPLLGERGVHRRRVLIPDAVVLLVPLVHRLDAGQAIGDLDVRPRIEFLWIEAVPPLAGAVRLRQPRRVISDARERAFSVVAVGRLEPVPRMRRVVADTELQPLRACDLAHVPTMSFFGPDVDRVPGMVPGIERVEVVVVVGQAEEIFRAGAFVERHQLLGFPALGLPEVVDLHEADLRRVAVRLHVIVVGRVALQIHPARVPVTLLGHALRRPVGPDAELGVPEPLGHPVVLRQRIPRRSERSRRNDTPGGSGGRSLPEHGRGRVTECRRSSRNRRCLQEITPGESGSHGWMPVTPAADYRTPSLSNSANRCYRRAAGLRECGVDHCLRGAKNRVEMGGALEALRIDLVDVFRARRTGGEPAVPGDDLQAANRRIVPRRPRELRTIGSPASSVAVTASGESLASGLLLRSRRRVAPAVIRCPQFTRQGLIALAGIPPGACRQFGSKQAEDQSVLVRRPDRAVTPEKTCTRALFSSEALRRVQKTVDEPLEPDRHLG